MMIPDLYWTMLAMGRFRPSPAEAATELVLGEVEVGSWIRSAPAGPMPRMRRLSRRNADVARPGRWSGACIEGKRLSRAAGVD